MHNSHDNLKTNLAALVNEAYCLVAIPLGMLPWRFTLVTYPKISAWRRFTGASRLSDIVHAPGLTGRKRNVEPSVTGHFPSTWYLSSFWKPITQNQEWVFPLIKIDKGIKMRHICKNYIIPNIYKNGNCKLLGSCVKYFWTALYTVAQHLSHKLQSSNLKFHLTGKRFSNLITTALFQFKNCINVRASESHNLFHHDEESSKFRSIE